MLRPVDLPWPAIKRSGTMYALVALGSALGGVFRYWCGDAITALTGGGLPWGTIFINVLGSLIIGFFATATGTDGRFIVPATIRTFVMIGFCGGYTTFSSFSLETFDLLQAGKLIGASANIAISLAVCLAAVWLGHAAAAALNRSPGRS
jgi:fluoride exporter